MVERIEPHPRASEPGPWEVALRHILDDGRRRNPLTELRVLAVPEWLLFHLAHERGLRLRVPYMAGWAVDMVLALDLGDVCVRTGWLPLLSGVERITAHTSLCSPPMDGDWFCDEDIPPDEWSSLTSDNGDVTAAALRSVGHGPYG
jgi:hypothetical protein